MELTASLKEFGLSDNEVKIYLALIKTGETTAQSIAKNADIPRTTAYHLLEGLIQKGLVSFIVKESKKYFQATNPKKLVNILDEKKKLMQEIIPQLMDISNTIKEKPKVMVYEGVKGIRAVLKDILEEKKIIYHVGEIISMQKVFAHAFPQFITERIKRKIMIKIIGKKEEELHKELIKNAKKEFREFVFVPKEYKFKASIFIYAKKVIIFNIIKEPYYAIVIENEDFYETQKNMFEMMWDLGKHQK